MKMKKKHVFLAMLACLLAFGLVITACNGDSDVAVTLVSVTAVGSPTTTALELTFSEAIPGLTADHITLTGVSGVSKGTLISVGAVYTLPVSGFVTGGTLNVAVSKSGFAISGSPQTVTLRYMDVAGTSWRITGLVGYDFLDDGTYIQRDLFKDDIEEEGTWTQEGRVVTMTVTVFHDLQNNHNPEDVVGLTSVGTISECGLIMTVVDWKDSEDDYDLFIP